MEHAQIRNLLGQHISDLIAQPGNLPLTLRPFQTETLESTAKWLSDPQGTKRSYVNHATGLGKTVLFASMVSAALGMRSLVVVPTKTLLEQTARVIAKFTGGMLGHISSLANIQDNDGGTIAVRGMDHSAVVLTTDASFNKLATKIGHEFDPHLIIRDECHWGYIGPALAALNQFPEAVIIGFSATPDYLTNTPKGGYVPVKLENGQVLYGPRDRFAETHFQTCLDRRSVRWGIESGWLCPLAWGMIEFDVNLKNVPLVDGLNGPDYDEAKLQELMGKHWSIMCETVRRLYDNPDYALAQRQTYSICPSVEAAEELAQAVGSLGVSSACVTGNTPDTERNILLRAFDDGEIRFLSSVMVLREGWDAPDAEVCMMLRPTKSRVLYEQGMGRALRRPENNSHKVALILDAHFQASTFSPLSAPVLFGKPGQEIPVGGMLIRGSSWVCGGEGVESPYLPKNAEPRLVVVEMSESMEYPKQGAFGREGYFEEEGETWAVIRVASEFLGVSRHLVRDRIKAAKQPLRFKKLPNHNGSFYALNDLKVLCELILRLLPKAGEDGTIFHQGEVWIIRLAASLKLGVSSDTIARKIAAGSIRSIEGYSQLGGKSRIFYSLKDLMVACEKVASALPQAGCSGTFLADGKNWATVRVIANTLDLREETVRARVKKAGELTKREGKDVSGQVADFYLIEEVNEACSDLLKEVPKAGKGGVFLFDGEVWATMKNCRRILGLKHEKSTMARIARSGLRFREGRIAKGSIEKIYPLAKVKEVCADLMPGTIPVSNNGVLTLDGEEWAHVSALCGLLDIPRYTAKLIICNSIVRTRKAREGRGKITPYYSVDDAKRVLSDGVNLPTPRKRRGDG